jgi:hypothetical protein
MLAGGCSGGLPDSVNGDCAMACDTPTARSANVASRMRRQWMGKAVMPGVFRLESRRFQAGSQTGNREYFQGG